MSAKSVAKDNSRPSSNDITASESLEKLSTKKIYFGHQSVGFNIVEGISDINHSLNDRLNILETRSPDSFKSPIFAHSTVGINKNPKSKLEDFAKLMEEGIGENVDYAFMKFCYVDIVKETDINELFVCYKKRFTGLINKYQHVKFIHMTVPLTTVQAGPKAFVKKIIGRPIGGYADNYKRNLFNQMIKNEYENSRSLFDLAMIESASSNGSAIIKKINGKTFYSLAPMFTYDGGHLNETGRLVVARALLSFLANLS